MSLRLLFLALLIGLVGQACADSSSVLRVLAKLRLRKVLSDEDKTILATAEENDLPKAVRRMVTVVSQGAHTCCRNTPVSIVKKSRASRRVTTHQSKFKAGNAHCGLWGWKRCGRYEMRYKEVVTYFREYYQVSVQGKCPEKDIVCCHLYIDVSGRCVDVHKLNEASAKAG